jgi:lysophospholipase
MPGELPAPPPLVAIPGAPVPDHGLAEWFKGADGVALRAALFRPEGVALGSVVLSPGRSEPIEKYFEVVSELLGRGLVVLAHDWRGQGLSQRLLPDRLKGHAVGFMPFVDDYRRLLEAFADRLPKPWIAVGHSMGGALTLAALARDALDRRPSPFAAAILSAPMIAVHTGGRNYFLSRLLAWLVARSPLRTEFLFGAVGDPDSATFESEVLTHDRVRHDRFAAQLKACPDLKLGNLTWAWLDSAFALAGWLRRTKGVEGIDIPVTIVSAQLDNRVANWAQAAIAPRLAKGRLLSVAGAYHEVLMETDDLRAVFWQAFDALLEVVTPPPARG